MYRNPYNTQSNFTNSGLGMGHQSQYRYTSTTGFGQRAPLYPIGPTLTQPQFKPMQQRGLSPSPYLSREGMKPPSYEHKYLQKVDNHMSGLNLTHEEREKRLIQKNEKQIEEEQKRRQQIRASYERQIRALTTKLNRNLQKKMKLHAEIQNLQKNHEASNQRLLQMRPPERTTDNLEHIDRKQQEMIILKNRLMSTMRENQTQLNKKQEQQQKYWQAQIADKQKYLFQIQQNLRQKRLQLYVQKQKSEQKPDFLSIEQQIRNQHYTQFLQQYQQLQLQLQHLSEQRQKINKSIQDTIEVKKPQFHNNSIRREEIKRDTVNLELRVKELERVAVEMDAVNKNLVAEYERKQAMITKYEQDIHNLRSKKQQVESDINRMMEEARNRDSASLSKQLTGVFAKLNDKIRAEQARGAKLKNAYQKLYELLCSATSKNIHQTFNQSLIA